MTDLNALKYSEEHEWLLIEGDIVTVGITSYAAAQLGDIVFVELPEPGTASKPGSVLGEIESTKSVGELYAPLDGTVTEANEEAVAEPSLVNSDPFGRGWLIKLQFSGDLPEGLMDHAAYQALVGGEA